MTQLWYDPLFLEHRPGAQHPERPDRLRSILEGLAQRPIAGLERPQARPATLEELLRIHPRDHVDALLALRNKSAVVDADTLISPATVDAALLAAGCAVESTSQVLQGKTQNAFVLVRPPGHHAEPSRAMGFCFFNNIAVAAQAALDAGAQRVAIVDFDVHHGNGTQAAFWDRRDVLFLSAHQAPLYPGTGAVEEIGAGEGAGFSVNCPLPAGMRDADYGAVFRDVFLPVLDEYAPDLVLVSAGFDAHEADPLADMRLTERGFAAMMAAVKDLARQRSGGKLVALLEGGYDLGALADSVHASVEVLSGRQDTFPGTGVSAPAGQAIRVCRQTLRPYWKAFA